VEVLEEEVPEAALEQPAPHGLRIDERDVVALGDGLDRAVDRHRVGDEREGERERRESGIGRGNLAPQTSESTG